MHRLLSVGIFKFTISVLTVPLSVSPPCIILMIKG